MEFPTTFWDNSYDVLQVGPLDALPPSSPTRACTCAGCDMRICCLVFARL